MHSINKANFAILHWFGMNLAPRFTNMQAQLKHLCCACDPGEYSNFLIPPIGQIDRNLIASEKVTAQVGIPSRDAYGVKSASRFGVVGCLNATRC